MSGCQISSFLTTYLLTKVSDNAHHLYYIFLRWKDGKIQAMIYEQQLHYKAQLCPMHAEDSL